MTQPKAKPRAKLTYADYVAMTPPAIPGPRYQLINGELIEMASPLVRHQLFLVHLSAQMAMQVVALRIGEILIAPCDVHIDEFNTYQPDLLFVSVARRNIVDDHGVTGAPDVVVEILSDTTRRRDLNEKLPVYIAAGVREVWIVDLDTETVAVYHGDGANSMPVRTLTAGDVLTSDAVPGVAIELGPIFARAQATP